MIEIKIKIEEKEVKEIKNKVAKRIECQIVQEGKNYTKGEKEVADIIAKEAGAIVRYEYQQGKGNVVRRMFQEIEADCYVLIDGDDTYPAECAKEMVGRVLDRQADMVVGDRLSSTYFEENKRPFHNFGNSIVRFAINCIFKSDVKDIMTGQKRTKSYMISDITLVYGKFVEFARTFKRKIVRYREPT